MGRPTIHCDDPQSYAGKLSVRKMRLDYGGYDCNGTYFGLGPPLYWVSSKDNGVDFMLRASDRRAARDEVLEKYPRANVRK
jgi:hypothetical protein